MKTKFFFWSLCLLLLTFDVCAQWLTGTNGIYYNYANKYVAIGSLGNISHKLNVTSDMPYSIYSANDYSTSVTKYGLRSSVSGSTTTSYGLYSSVSSTGGSKYGLYSYVSGNGDKYGLWSECGTGTIGNVWTGYFKNGTVDK